MDKVLVFGGNARNPMIVYFMGRIYVANSLYALAGGLLIKGPKGTTYVNPDGYELREPADGIVSAS